MWPQPGVQRHTAAHIVDILPYVQILDVLVPQLGNQVVEFMQTLDKATPEQVIDVPKLSQDIIPQRFASRRTLKASLQRSAEQNIDIPVPGRGGGGGQGGLQGFSSGQNSTASGAEHVVDFPVGGGLQGFLPRQGSRTANKIR